MAPAYRPVRPDRLERPLGPDPSASPGHPQDTTENSVDLAHLLYVHGYGNVDRVGAVSVDGAYFRSDFDFRRNYKIARILPFNLDVSTNTHIFGLGYSFVEIREKSIGMDMRLWVLATPVDGTLIDLSLVSQVREIRNPRRRVAGLGFLPAGLRAPLMNRFIAAQQEQDVLRDVVIWSRKRYRSLPRLSRSDGEIMTFRAYCAQFYPEPCNPVATPYGTSGRACRMTARAGLYDLHHAATGGYTA